MFLTLYSMYNQTNKHKPNTENNSQQGYKGLGLFTNKLGQLTPSIALKKLQNGISDTLNFVLTQASANPALSSILLQMGTQFVMAQAVTFICESRSYDVTIADVLADIGYRGIDLKYKIDLSHNPICSNLQQHIGDEQCGELEIIGSTSTIKLTAI
jgi:hypothetical protein